MAYRIAYADGYRKTYMTDDALLLCVLRDGAAMDDCEPQVGDLVITDDANPSQYVSLDDPLAIWTLIPITKVERIGN